MRISSDRFTSSRDAVHVCERAGSIALPQVLNGTGHDLYSTYMQWAGEGPPRCPQPALAPLHRWDKLKDEEIFFYGLTCSSSTACRRGRAASKRRRRCGLQAPRNHCCNIMHGVELAISAVTEFSESVTLM
jgi:hypothetical protein